MVVVDWLVLWRFVTGDVVFVGGSLLLFSAAAADADQFTTNDDEW